MVGRGRRKTGMKLIEEKTARDVCFCKRRAGLFKKAKELSVLCGAKVGVLVFSRSGKPITFDAPTLQTLIARQLGDDITSVETESPPPPPAGAGADKGEALFQGSLAEKTSPFWWERADVGSMTLDELKTFASSLSVGIEERLKQLKDGDHAFDAQEKMMDPNVFPCQEEPSSIHDGSTEVPLMADIIVGEQSNDDQMKSHQPLLGGEYGWNAAAAAGQMMDESFSIPNSWPPSGNIEEQMLMEDSFFIPNLYSPAGNIEEQMLMDENFFIPNLCSPAAIEEQMLMDEHFFIPSLWSSSTDIGGGQQMPISFEDEPSSTDGRQLAAPNLLPCKPSFDATKTNTSFQPLTWSDLFMQHQWI